MKKSEGGKGTEECCTYGNWKYITNRLANQCVREKAIERETGGGGGTVKMYLCSWVGVAELWQFVPGIYLIKAPRPDMNVKHR